MTLLLALALVASACQVTATNVSHETSAGAGVDASVTPAATATALPTPTRVPLAENDEAEPTDPTGGGATPFTGSRPPTSTTPDAWNTDLALDPAVVEGQLDNGLRYLILQNGRPGSQAQLRLVVEAGSLNEAPGTSGAAHFLEHMMFNGTERFPGNEIVQVLEAFGSGFGPDINAYTSYQETVYELQVPSRSSATLQLGLDVLYQWATAATIDLEAVIDERGVVREEYRRGAESLNGRIGEQIRSVLFAGTPFLGRAPIGELAVIDSLTDTELRAFYEQWYRPELMTVVAVGDFDVREMERRITDTFVQPVSAAPQDAFDATIASPVLEQPTYSIITDPEIQATDVEVLWRMPSAPLTSPIALRDNLVALMAFGMIDTRLFERIQGGESALVSAAANAGPFVANTALASVSATADADTVESALAELLTELERARQHGFTAQELERQRTQLLTGVEQQFAESSTRQDTALAADLVAYALGRDVLTEPAEQQRVATEVLESITPADTQAFLFDVLEAPPYVLVTSPEATAQVLPATDALEALYLASVGAEVDAVTRQDIELERLMERPDAAEIVNVEDLEGGQGTIVTYQNGLRLAYRQSAVIENAVEVDGYSPGGYFAIDGPAVPLLDAAATMANGSGFTSIDFVTLDRFLTGSVVSLETSIGRVEERIDGSAATEDLELLFQLIHLQMTEPTISELEVRRFEESWRAVAEEPASTPAIAADLELWRLRYGDSPWFRYIPTPQDLDTLDPDLLLDAYRDRFDDAGDFIFAVVGDFDPDEVVDLGARYLGTLPDTGTRETPIDRDPGVPEANLLETVAAGLGDQGRVRINWESPYPFTLEADVTAQAVELVVNARLRDLIREELGASYSPNAAVSVLAEPKSWVDTIIEVESDPDRLAEVSDAVRDELTRIRAGDFDQQYLDLAIDQLVEGYRFFTNQQYLDRLIFHTYYPERPATEYTQRSALAESLSRQDIAEAAAVIFPESRSVEIWLVPQEQG